MSITILKEVDSTKSLVIFKVHAPKYIAATTALNGIVEQDAYNLDVIISVGYRVKSINGTDSVSRPNSILKQYIIKGYAINQKRLDNLQRTEKKWFFDVVQLHLQDQVSRANITEYISMSSATMFMPWILSTKYDYQTLLIDKNDSSEPFHATYENAMGSHQCFEEKFGGSNGLPIRKDDSFKTA